jgi:cytochrome P450
MEALDPRPEVRYPELRRLQQKCPVHPMGSAGMYMAVGYDSVATGLRKVSEFAGSAGQRGLPEDDTMISAIPEPRHGAVRRIINSVVAFHKSQQIEPYLTQFISDCMSEVLQAARSGPVDVMPSFVERIPPAAMARLLGFPEDDSAAYFKWGEQLAATFGKAAAEGRSLAMRDACPAMASYVEEQIDRRLKLPIEEWPNDALTRFLTTEVDGERLSRPAVTTQIMFAIGAGSDTTRNVLGSLLFRLANSPDIYSEIRANRTLIELAVEEALRIDSPAQFLVRECRAEHFELGGQQIEKGDTILLSLAAANRDEEVFEDADTFLLERRNIREHLGFGTGPHICPGSALARLELRLAVSIWCDRVSKFELAPGYVWDSPRTGMLHGPRSLPLCLVGA